MARKLDCWWFVVPALGAVVVSASAQVDPKVSKVPGATKREHRAPWLERPWELRYFLYVTPDWQRQQGFAKATNAERHRGTRRTSFMWREYFEPFAFFQFTDRWAQPGEGLSAVRIEFDKSGTVTSKHSLDTPLRGRIDTLLYMALSTGDDAGQPRFDLGRWFMGLGDVSTHWAPGLCGLKHVPSPFSLTDPYYLYGPKFTVNKYSQTFGCREWAYQLNDQNRPYIDITSYIPKQADPDGPGTYIHPTMGWSSFRDAPKPVIGKHEATWYCLHECPGGDPPGVIPDIQAWARKNGWNAPKPPTRIPVFPDPPANSGTYP